MSPLALFRISLLIITVLLCSCREAAIEEKINRSATNVEGFDLVLDDSTAKAEFGLFEIGYAIKANYKYFTYRDKLYQSVGGGSVLIRPIKDSPARFIVREVTRSKDGSGMVKESTLLILDKSNGDELARRNLISGSVENGTGWTGDHAMLFVRKVLTSEHPPKRPWGGWDDYVQSMAKIELIKPTDSIPYPRNEVLRNCPNTLRIERRPANVTLAGAGFEFLPSSPLQFVACDSGRVLVASGVFSSNLSLDLLTIDGQHIAQGYMHLPLPSEAFWFDMPEVTLATNSISAVLLVNSRLDWHHPFVAFAQVQVNAILHCHNPDCISQSPQ